MLNYLQQISGKEHDTVSHTSEIKLLGYKPNAASSGSFFHFPSEAGGLSHITVLCKSKSPMERSATCQPQTHAQRNSVFQSKVFFLEFQFKKTFLDLILKQTNKTQVHFWNKLFNQMTASVCKQTDRWQWMCVNL